MIKAGLESFRGKNVLFLQGPRGPFFRLLAKDFEAAGAHTWRVSFNGGDLAFNHFNSIIFTGKMEEWGGFFEKILTERAIDVVLLFGDCRWIHRTAHEIALRRGIEIGVFEEGYVRPDYITLERFGVNGYSRIPTDPSFYRRLAVYPEEVETKGVGNTFPNAVVWAIIYYTMSALLWPFFRHYRHHRPLHIFEGIPWLRSLWRKYYYRAREAGVFEKLTGRYSGKFFLVPLQVHDDFQISVHSSFTSVVEFIEGTMKSFAAHAPKDTILAVKHHPLDRGYHDYRSLIRRLATELGLSGRVFYIHDQHLPTLLNHARGVVMINSTVGISALYHGAPLKVTGTALYDMKGLTFQGSLDEFWVKAPKAKPDMRLFKNFRNYLIECTQINGSFYKRLAGTSSHAGIIWQQKAHSEGRPEQKRAQNS